MINSATKTRKQSDQHEADQSNQNGLAHAIPKGVATFEVLGGGNPALPPCCLASEALSEKMAQLKRFI